VPQRSVTRELDPDPLAARVAREFVAATCREWRRTDELETLMLLTSELVTNGILHAGTALSVAVRADDVGLVVEVHDNDPRPPTARSERVNLLADIDAMIASIDDDAVDDRHATVSAGPAGAIGAGRGLLLVEALADEWGVELAADGKSVWFRVTD
jgi:anti-sigma regulatory factor (Ser/Thr protein kinase)